MPVELSEIVATTRGLDSVVDVLIKAGFEPENCDFDLLSGDGSDRKFIRINPAAGKSILAILPGNHPEGILEARSSWQIGRHLQKCGVPVPDMISHDDEKGTILCEDLGDTLLYNHLQSVEEDVLPNLYQGIIDILVDMQIKGREGFNAEMCWNQPVYDRRTMLDRESDYFLVACCQRILGDDSAPTGLDSEFYDLAELAGKQTPDFFLHRDFQSRNIMIKDGALRVIDFQGGRFGPLAYDLASLLIDPYVQLSSQLQYSLLEYYIDRASELTLLDRDRFRECYIWLAIQRNLQILGAFAFLSIEKGKSFFRQFLYPASTSLLELLDGHRIRFPILQNLTNDLVEHLKEDLSI